MSNSNIWTLSADNNIKQVQSLISSGQFTPNSADPNGYTPIHAAVSYGHLDLLRYLLNNGGNVNIQDSDGDTPLHHSESLEVARVLVNEFKANYRIKNKDGLTPAQYAESEDEFPELIEYLTNLERTGDDLVVSHSNNIDANSKEETLSLPNGEEIKMVMSSVAGDESNPALEERRKQLENIFNKADLSESEKDDKLKQYVMGIVTDNLKTIKDEVTEDDEGDHKRRK